jgi:hypothetical protein
MMQCTARSKRSGEQCKRHAVPGRNVCAMHGGKTPGGIASPHFKSGRYSKHLPERLMERYQQALHDDDLLNLRHEVALVDTRIAELLEQVERGDLGGCWLELKEHFDTLTLATQKQDLGAGRVAFEQIGSLITGGANDYQVWTQISAMLEQRRKLVDTERRRLVDMQQMITSEQAMTLVGALIGIIREEVTDRHVLASLQTRITGLLVTRTGARSDAAEPDDDR